MSSNHRWLRWYWRQVVRLVDWMIKTFAAHPPVACLPKRILDSPGTSHTSPHPSRRTRRRDPHSARRDAIPARCGRTQAVDASASVSAVGSWPEPRLLRPRSVARHWRIGLPRSAGLRSAVDRRSIAARRPGMGAACRRQSVGTGRRSGAGRSFGHRHDARVVLAAPDVVGRRINPLIIGDGIVKRMFVVAG